MGRISNFKISSFLNSFATAAIKQRHVNTRKNLFPAYEVNSSALDKLPRVMSICDISIEAGVPHGGNNTAVVFQVVDPHITEGEVHTPISSTTSILHYRRFCRLSCMNLIFRGGSLSASVDVNLVRYPVRPTFLRPLRRRRCMRVNNVINRCPSEPRCSHCDSDHGTDVCPDVSPSCVNRLGGRDVNSEDCPRLQKELKT